MKRFFNNLFRTKTPTIRKSGFRPGFESLEARVLLATRIWDGGGISPLWSNAQNWVGDVAPAVGDALEFPEATTRLSVHNDYAPNTFFYKLSFQDRKSVV